MNNTSKLSIITFSTFDATFSTDIHILGADLTGYLVVFTTCNDAILKMSDVLMEKRWRFHYLPTRLFSFKRRGYLG